MYSSDCLFVSGPINREMRHLISTLQNHNQQMKGEVVKYKLRLREAQSELNQVGQKETKNASAKYSLCYVYEGSQSFR